MNVLQVCAYAADYEGNFMKSLYSLENIVKKNNGKMYYAFPENAQQKQWCIELAKRTKVFFLPLAKARILPECYIKLRKILKEEKIDIVHSHFELYDIHCNLMKSKNTKVFWHLHDPITNETRLSRQILNKIQYSLFSKNTKLLSVSAHYRDVVIDFGFNKNNTDTILNGIDLQRVSYPYSDDKKYDFLTFGWDFERKGSDIIFKALTKLYNDGYKFKLLFNCNEDTLTNLNSFFNGKYPEWLEIGMPVEDINTIFSKTTTFIQASRRETFSYAVCEAAYAGLNVVASEIYGLEWAHDVPTVSFFENEDVVGLYNILKCILEKKVYNNLEKIKESRKIIEDNFSTEIWAKNIYEFYME